MEKEQTSLWYRCTASIARRTSLSTSARDHLGDGIVRNLMQSRSGGCDLIGLDGWSIEVKRAAKPRLSEWWAQALAQAQSQECRPCLAYRLDRAPWKFIVSLRDVAPSLAGQSPHLIAELGIAEFVLLVRERIAC